MADRQGEVVDDGTWRRVAIWALVIAAAAVLIAVVAVAVSLERQRQADADNQSRRVTACHNYNDDQVKSVNALNDRVQNLLDQTFNAPGVNRAPDLQARIDSYLQKQHREFDAIKLKPRDCSPAGIAAYYRSKP